MPGHTTHEATALLSRWSGGDKAAPDLPIPPVRDEPRHSGGLTVEVVAEVAAIPPIKVKWQWKAAVAWLHHALKQGGGDGD